MSFAMQPTDLNSAITKPVPRTVSGNSSLKTRPIPSALSALSTLPRIESGTDSEVQHLTGERPSTPSSSDCLTSPHKLRASPEPSDRPPTTSHPTQTRTYRPTPQNEPDCCCGPLCDKILRFFENFTINSHDYAGFFRHPF